jgi:hypothetical protein
MYNTPLAEAEYQLSRNVFQRETELNELAQAKVVVPVRASVFFRSNKRKPRETFIAYRRGLNNAKKALKAYMIHGESTQVLLNRKTMVIV